MQAATTCRPAVLAAEQTHSFEVAPCGHNQDMGTISPMAYETRYCAYVDILAFRSLIHDLDAGKITEDDMEELFYRLQTAHMIGASAADDVDLKVQSISDAVLLSSAATGEGLKQLVSSLVNLTLFLLIRGYFVRGGLVKGKLVHGSKAIYGSGLVSAFDLESKVARYPRIIVTREVYRDALLQHTIDGQATTFLTWGNDGPFFVHALKKMELVFSQAHSEDQQRLMSAEWNVMAQRIQERYDESVDNPAHFEKVRWFAEYWNGCAELYPYLVLPVRGRGLGGAA